MTTTLCPRCGTCELSEPAAIRGQSAVLYRFCRAKHLGGCGYGERVITPEEQVEMDEIARMADGEPLSAPFPYFGGKRRVAAEIWSRLGDTANYVEPFAGSLAVLLARPPQHLAVPRIETVNDLDGLLCNFWRAMKLAPAEVAEHADWPVIEIDLHARHRWLVDHRPSITAQLEADPEWCDPRAAGWWVWGISAWIGGGWCAERVSRQRPQASYQGQGIHSLGNSGTGFGDLFAALALRLRRVRVITGDWQRVLTPAVTTVNGLTAVVLDPPYDPARRAGGIYATGDDSDVAQDVSRWAAEHGADPMLRIALCGYAGEHDHLEALGWSVYAWSGSGSYSKPGTQAEVNRHLERVWFSPHCLAPDRPQQMALWEGEA